jgi:hypothetical protein
MATRKSAIRKPVLYYIMLNTMFVAFAVVAGSAP